MCMMAVCVCGGGGGGGGGVGKPTLFKCGTFSA